jgi:hypothetical protein
MIEPGRPCLELAQQLHTVEKAIGEAKRTLTHDHIEHCLDRWPERWQRERRVDQSGSARRSPNIFNRGGEPQGCSMVRTALDCLGFGRHGHNPATMVTATTMLRSKPRMATATLAAWSIRTPRRRAGHRAYVLPSPRRRLMRIRGLARQLRPCTPA